MEQYVINEKGQNKLQILNLLMTHQGISATEVSQKTNLSAATVSRVFNEFKEKELICFQRKEKTEKGRCPDLYTFNWEYGFFLHYYITNKAIHGYIADLGGTILNKISYAYHSKDTLDDFFSIIKKLKFELSKTIQNKQGQILTAGFSIPGVVNEESRTIYTIPDAHQLNNIKFFDYAERVLEMPVIANNISWLSAVGEKTHVYSYANSLVYIVFTYLGGIGAGIIYKNELIKGGMHYAGEIGQTWFDHNYSLEEYISGKGLYEHTASIQHLFHLTELALEKGKAVILQDLFEKSDEQRLTLEMLEDAASKGDKDVIRLLDDAIRTWAGIIINVNLIINPEFIILGGCFSIKNQYIFHELNNYLKKIKLFQPQIQMSVSGEDSQLYGGLQMLKEYADRTFIFKEAVR